MNSFLKAIHEAANGLTKLNGNLGHWVTIKGKPVFIKSKSGTQVSYGDIVPNENKYDVTLNLKKPMETEFYMQTHLAHKAGPHKDLRLHVDGQAVSWALPKDLPKEGEKRLAVMQPLHDQEFSKFTGDFPEGEYGAGKYLLEKGNFGKIDITRWDPKVKKFIVLSGKNQGEYTLFKGKFGGNNWLIMKTKPKEEQADRMEFAKAELSFKPTMWEDKGYVAEEKMDGARYALSLGDKYNRILSRHKSEDTGLHTERTHNLPYLRDIKTNLAGTIADGEIIGKNVEHVVRIMGSSPDEAREKLKTLGDLKFHIFDCPRFKGKDIRNLPYSERRTYVDKIYNALHSEEPSHIEKSKLVYDNKQDFYNKVVAKKGEGVVLKALDGKYDDKFMTKSKHTDTWDMVITGFEKGSGKYEGKLATLRIGYRDSKTGKFAAVGKVHSGLKDSDINAITNNPYKYLGQVVEVSGMHLTKTGAVRAPVFKRWRIGEKTWKDVNP